ncbi:iron complex transport system permease protein [Sanguibacter gelidistatuariae]|uniref:Iron complex transport system permease protein n=1 Tax=Sanguibacter gelidistatuariae TaxID=1814289 RepID=A0A1G6UY35_9MICO|nr:iron ABC transporter permease [Sanguibacter gelidistatuariae]SDD46164.1 iron complex transport system permease protein [Sanguibacter gelidistatuariae]
MTAALDAVQGRTLASGPVRRWGLGAGLILALAATALVTALSLSVGTNQLPLSTVWHGLVSPDDSFASTVIASRVPRTLLGLLVGAGLAVAGTLMQGITRNPLADPGLLGVNAGASAAIVAGTVVFGSLGQRAIFVAVPGAFLAAVVVYAIGSGRSGPTPVRLVLSGAAITAVLMAGIQAVTLTNPEVFETYRFWVVGSLAGRPSEIVDMIWPVVVVGLVAALLLGRPLNTLALGDETARALGGNAGRTRLLGALVATVLAGACTAAVGPIAFVGLAVPHIVRTITGSDYRWLVAYCIALGPVLLLGADVVGRIVARPGELMVGVVTAFIGAPFLYVAVRRSGSGL